MNYIKNSTIAYQSLLVSSIIKRVEEIKDRIAVGRFSGVGKWRELSSLFCCCFWLSTRDLREVVKVGINAFS